MEIQFQKSVFPCLKTVCRQYLSQEQTQEVRVPEGMPDIGTVLTAWGQMIIRGKDWHASSAGVTGGVMVWVLYLPEDGSAVQQLETWLPFQQTWDFPETTREGNLQVIPMLRSVDARTLSARKMMVRASVGILGQATVPEELELYTPEQLPEDIQVLKKTYPLRLPVEMGEKAFHLEENLSVPNTNVPIEKLLRYWINPSLSEMKVVADKLVMRGIAGLGALYRGTDGQLHTWEHDLPFSQYSQLNRDYAPQAQADICFAVTSLELEPSEDNTLNLKVGLSGQYTLYDTATVEIAEDAYSLTRQLTPQWSKVDIPAILDSRADTVTAQQNLQTDMLRVLDVCFYPENPGMHHQGDTVHATLSGTFQVLGYSPDGELQTATVRWESPHTISADDNVELEMSVLPIGRPTGAAGPGEVALSAPIQLQTNTVFAQSMEYLTNLETGEAAELDPGRPSLILRCAGNDSLWEIAKSAGSTVADIQKANNLQSEPEQTQMLLIPVR
ncbi:MAG: DUF3794 domain-containing protein [Oscillospiraceae bacterium]|nr:DUF3794 domain-containing protein [Oscillospiraceae bacterium]